MKYVTVEDVVLCFKNLWTAKTEPQAVIYTHCAAALTVIFALLDKKKYRSDPAVAYAAACRAYYTLQLAKAADIENSSDFQAGDIRIKTDRKIILDCAKTMKINGMRAVQHLLKDEGFGAWAV